MSPPRRIDIHFRQFAKDLEGIIAGHDDGVKMDRGARQRSQVLNLVRLERAWRKALIKHAWGPRVYEKFVGFITDQNQNNNILTARPYFRERQEIFSKEISPALRNRKAKALYRFDVNYQFIAWTLKQYKWQFWTSVAKLAKEVEEARRQLIELNTPLAISRARIFFRYNPAAHMEFMDFVQVGTEGLIAAVDKLVMQDSQVDENKSALASVACGRMTGNFIEAATEPLIHYFPRDKKRAYRAHRARKLFGDDLTKIVQFVNTDPKTNRLLPLEERASSDEVQSLMAAASHVSSDTAIPHVSTDFGESESMISTYAADSSCQPDQQFEEKEAMTAIYDSMQYLTMLERKLLKMKGLDLDL